MFRQRPDNDPSPARSAPGAVSVRVWDTFLRAFHWSLVAAVAAAAVTGFLAGATWIDVHVWAGTVMAGLVAARLAWGFLGSAGARFAGFVVGPRAVLAHVRGLGAGTAGRHLGHNPLGALMVVTLLAVATALAATGAVAYGGVLKTGPAAALTSFAAGRAALEVHELLAFTLLGLVGLHLGGVAFESRRGRENLALAMVTGDKPARVGDHVAPPRTARPLAAAVLSLGVIGAGAVVLAAMASRPPLGVPAAALDPVYAAECAACHVAYHPSLLPAASWNALLDGLDSHFGEDAGLDAATTAGLRDWVQANAAEAYDTKAANRLRTVAPAAPFTITATRFWRRTHAAIPASVFAAPAVATRGNCEACHSDARAGRFHPGSILVPMEARP